MPLYMCTCGLPQEETALEQEGYGCRFPVTSLIKMSASSEGPDTPSDCSWVERETAFFQAPLFRFLTDYEVRNR